MNATVKDAVAGGAAAEGLADWIKPSRTALVIIDIQVDFALPEGVLGQAGLDMSVVERGSPQDLDQEIGRASQSDGVGRGVAQKIGQL